MVELKGSSMLDQGREIRTVGILGAGRVGTAVGRQALRAGFRVRIATARPADEIELIVDVIAPGAEAVDAPAVAGSDLVVLAVPLHRYRTVDPTILAGRTVIDVMNYWAPIDGVLDDFEGHSLTSSEVVQEHFGRSTIVKTLNHIGYHDLEEDGRETGHPARRGLVLAGDDPTARRKVASFLDALGYDPVDAGPLAAGRIFQPGTEIFTGSHTAVELETILQSARQLRAA